MAGAQYPKELANWALVSVGIGAVEGAVAAALVRARFADAASPLLVDLAMALQDAGVNVWLDTIHVVDDLDWRKQIEDALRRSGLVLAIISPESLDDQEAIEEREYAIMSGKMLMPVISQRVRLSEIRFWQPPIDCTRNFDLGVKHIISMITSNRVQV